MKLRSTFERVKPILKPRISNLAITFILIVLALFWMGASDINFPNRIVAVLTISNLPIILPSLGVVSLFLALVWCYVFVSLVFFPYKMALKKNKLLFATLMIPLVLVIGIDEPIVKVLRRPNYNCNADGDCALKQIWDSPCEMDCVNKEWEQYWGLLDRTPTSSWLGLCKVPEGNLCVCEQNRCMFSKE